MPRLGFKPDFAAVAFHNPLADGQTDAGAGIFLLGMQALKENEHPLGILRLDADAVVFDGKQPFAASLTRGDVDARQVCAGGKLARRWWLSGISCGEWT